MGVIAAAGLPAVGHPGKAAATGRAGHARHPEAAIDDHHAVVRVTTEDWPHVVHPGHRADAADRMAVVATAAGAPSVAAAGGSTCGCARVQGVARHGGRSQAEMSCLLLLSCSRPGHSATQPWQVHPPSAPSSPLPHGQVLSRLACSSLGQHRVHLAAELAAAVAAAAASPVGPRPWAGVSARTSLVAAQVPWRVASVPADGHCLRAPAAGR